jgi:NADP-dependent 3-hydroxy acid dehydrogenase YdfG
LIGNKNYSIRILSRSPLTGEVRTEMVEAAGYSGASDDYYKVNPTLDPENIAAGVLFMLSLPYKVQVKEKMYFPLV